VYQGHLNRVTVQTYHTADYVVQLVVLGRALLILRHTDVGAWTIVAPCSTKGGSAGLQAVQEGPLEVSIVLSAYMDMPGDDLT
jgi:hypothetical protein